MVIYPLLVIGQNTLAKPRLKRGFRPAIVHSFIGMAAAYLREVTNGIKYRWLGSGHSLRPRENVLTAQSDHKEPRPVLGYSILPGLQYLGVDEVTQGRQSLAERDDDGSTIPFSKVGNIF
jgi:hypothetical protein